ncbi:MAG: hypothetical protein H8D67_18930 [Deltaproteobacteria bacterium]|nr:hypothetical protein [Deltaproteobacteria bacterium]
MSWIDDLRNFIGKPGGTHLSAAKSIIDAIGHDGTSALDTGIDGKLGTPAGADVSTDIAAIKAETATIVADTNELQTDWVNGGRLDLLVDGIKAITDALPDAGALTTIDTNVDDIETDTNELQTDWTDGGRLDLILDAIADAVAAGAGTTGTADAGSTAGMLRDAARTEADDYWNGMMLIMESGVNAGLARVIVDFVAATDDALVEPDFPNVIGAGDVYTILSRAQFATIIIGNNNADNVADTSNVVANVNGSVLERIEGLQGTAFDPTTESLAVLHDDHITQITAGRMAELDAANLPADVDAILVDTGTTIPATLTTIDTVVDAIKAVTDALPDAGALTTIDTNVDDIETDTNELQTDWTNGGRLDLIVDELTTQGDTNETKIDTIDTVVDAIKAVTDALPDAGALTTIDTNVDDIETDTNELQTDWTDGGRLDLLIDAIKAKTDNLPTDPADESLLEAAIATSEGNVRGADGDTLETLSDQMDALDIGVVKASVAVTINATNAGETNVFNLATAGHVYQVRHLRLKSADPGANTIAVKLYEEINDVQTVVDTFTIDTNNYGDYHSATDMFGIPDIDGENLKVTVQASAGGPYAITGQYVYSDVTVG